MEKLKFLFPCLFCLLVIVSTGCNKKRTNQSRDPVTHKVVIRGMAFHPAELTVVMGDTVVWVNKDIVTHNVTAYPGEEWTSGPITSGASWETVIDSSFDYYCSIHPAMKGKITVKNSE